MGLADIILLNSFHLTMITLSLKDFIHTLKSYNKFVQHKQYHWKVLILTVSLLNLILKQQSQGMSTSFQYDFHLSHSSFLSGGLPSF